jgi:hypothetical protein
MIGDSHYLITIFLFVSGYKDCPLLEYKLKFFGHRKQMSSKTPIIHVEDFRGFSSVLLSKYQYFTLTWHSKHSALPCEDRDARIPYWKHRSIRRNRAEFRRPATRPLETTQPIILFNEVQMNTARNI